MLRFTVAALALGWACILAVAFGFIPQDSRLGFGPLLFLGASTLTGIAGGIEDPEYRSPYLLLAAGSFASCMLYAVLRALMVVGLAGN